MNSIANLYDQFAAEGYEDRAADQSSYPIPPAIIVLLQKYQISQADKTVLDLGCGPGNLKDYTNFATYIGVDLSPEMLQAAAKRGYQQLIESDVLSFAQLATAKIADLIFCLSVTYFLSPDELTALLQALKRLKAEYWFITLDAIPTDLIALYQKEWGIALYDHTSQKLPGEIERVAISGWLSPIDQKPITIQVVVGK